jgi:uncharacterized protein DUF6230
MAVCRTRSILKGGSVKDAQGDPAYGRTNWRRFAVAVGVPTVVAGAMVFGLANGAFAASFAVSGQAFKISASELVGEGFAQYSDTETVAYPKDGSAPLVVAKSGIKHATLHDLCQSVHPAGSPVSLTINAGNDPLKPAEADDLLIGLTELSGDATFTEINIGTDAHDLKRGGDAAHSEAKGGFGQEAKKVTIVDLKQTAYSTTAASFTLRGLSLKINTDFKGGKPKECY